jgi:tellurite resistance protein
LLNAILGEVRELCGAAEVRGKLAFFAQSPFILNATVKANILFSHVDEQVDEERYQRALECCALTHDLGNYFPSLLLSLTKAHLIPSFLGTLSDATSWRSNRNRREGHHS